MKIYDGLVKKENSKELEKFLLREDFPWFYTNSSSGDSKKVKDKDVKSIRVVCLKCGGGRCESIDGKICFGGSGSAVA